MESAGVRLPRLPTSLVGRLVRRRSLRGLALSRVTLRSRLRRRGWMPRELGQAVAFAGGLTANHRLFLAQFNRAVGNLQSFFIFSLFINRERQAQHVGSIGLARVSINRLLEVFLRGREIVLVVFDRAHR